MIPVITQRELRNNSGEIMRGLDRGETYLLTRNGVPVGKVIPLQQPRQFVPAETLVEAFATAPTVDAERLRGDIDAVVDQDPTPRG